MSTLKKEKSTFKAIFIAYSYLVIGSLLFAVGDVMFVNPYRLAPGGTYGLANVFNTLWNWRISYYALCMDIPLLIVGTFILGPKFGFKTILSTILIFVFVWALEHTWGYGPVIYESMLETVSDTGLNFVPDFFLNTIIAGLIYGVAIGLIFKSGATSGGSDIISMIINKYTKISLGTLVIIVDSCITLSTLIAFGDIRLPIYSIILIFIEGKVIDIVIEGFKTYKTVFIITDETDKVRDFIVNNLNRGGTCFKGTGLYQGAERNMIYSTLTRNEFVKLRNNLPTLDPNAFINIVDSNDIIGKGFKNIHENNV